MTAHPPPCSRLFIQPTSDVIARVLELHLTDAFLARIARLFELVELEKLEHVATTIDARWHSTGATTAISRKTSMNVADYGITFSSFVEGSVDQEVHAIALYPRSDFLEQFCKRSSGSEDFLIPESESDWPMNAKSEQEIDHWFCSQRQAFAEVVQLHLDQAGLLPLRDCPSAVS